MDELTLWFIVPHWYESNFKFEVWRFTELKNSKNVMVSILENARKALTDWKNEWQHKYAKGGRGVTNNKNESSVFAES